MVNFENFIQSNKKPVTKKKKKPYDMLYFIFRNTQRHPIDMEDHLVIKN